MSEWKPIESAPKDGRDILLVVVEERHSKFAVGCWDDDEDFWVCDFRGKGNFDYVPATHWMPLPPPPVTRTIYFDGQPVTVREPSRNYPNTETGD